MIQSCTIPILTKYKSEFLKTSKIKYSRTPFIWILVIHIANYPDWLGLSG